MTKRKNNQKVKELFLSLVVLLISTATILKALSVI